MTRLSPRAVTLAVILMVTAALAGSPASVSAPADIDAALRTCDDFTSGAVSAEGPRSELDVLTWQSKAAIACGVSRTAGAFDADGKFHLICGNCNTHTSHPNDEIYNPATNTWAHGLAHPGGTYGVHNHDAAIIGTDIYVGGGSAGSAGYYNNFTKIDLVANTWTVVGAMPVTNLLYYKFAVANGKIYMFGGGVTGTVIQNTCYEFDPGTTTWTQKANMPAALRDVNTAVAGDTIYIFGGYTGTAAVNTMYKYSVTGNNYATGTVLPEANWWGRAVTYDDPVNGPVVYLLGGINTGGTILSTVRTYTVRTGVYGTETSMIGTRRSHAACLSASNQLFAAGGYSTAGILTTCEMAVLAPPAGVDVGVDVIRAPGPVAPPGVPVNPIGVVRNFGATAQVRIPVDCVVESLGVVVYNQTATVTGPVNPSDTARVTFSTAWTPGHAAAYTMKMFTHLTGDTMRSNDTARLAIATAGWQLIARPSTGTDRIVSATVYDPVNDMLYMFGGNPAGATGTYLNLAQVYDPIANTWTNKANMPTARGWIKGSYVRGKIYVIGGHSNSNTALAVNEIYDIAGNAWTTGAPRPLALVAALEAVWRDSLIFVMGGTNLTSGFTRVDVYDPFSNTWSTGTALPQVADMGSAVCIGDTIFITNAVNRGSSICWPNLVKGYVDPANPTNVTWITGPAHGQPTSITGTAAVGNKVYWLGGFVNLTTVSNLLWVYEVGVGTISQHASPYPITNCRCNFLVGREQGGGELYVFGGDSGGNWSIPNSRYSKMPVGGGSSGAGETPARLTLTLDNVRPNPVSGNARVSYTLSRDGNVTLRLYTVAGKLVSTVADGYRTAGAYSTQVDVGRLSRGIYVLKLTSGEQAATHKLVVR